MTIGPLLEFIRQLTERLATPRVRRWALVVSTLLFLAGLVISVRSRLDLLTAVNWWLLAIGFIAVSASIVLNGVGFLLTASLVRSPIGFRQALEVTVIGAAVNLLPLPGAAMVRVSALQAAGTRLRLGTLVTLTSGLLQVGVAMVVAGWVLLPQKLAAVGLGLLVVGVVLVILGFALCVWVSGRLVVSLAMILHKCARLLFTALQLWLTFRALNEVASLQQCLMLSVANVVASIVAVAPAGLGVREMVAAALAPLVDLSPAVAFLVTSLMRVVALAGALPLSLWFARWPGRTTSAGDVTSR